MDDMEHLVMIHFPYRTIKKTSRVNLTPAKSEDRFIKL